MNRTARSSKDVCGPKPEFVKFFSEPWYELSKTSLAAEMKEVLLYQPFF